MPACLLATRDSGRRGKANDRSVAFLLVKPDGYVLCRRGLGEWRQPCLCCGRPAVAAGPRQNTCRAPRRPQMAGRGVGCESTKNRAHETQPG